MIDTKTSQIILLQLQRTATWLCWAEILPVWSQSFINWVSFGEAHWEQGDLNLF